MIIYGAGLNAQEYFRWLGRQGRAGEVSCFAVTKRDRHPENLMGKPLLSIAEAVRRFPEARIVVVLQEKFHGEVRELLQGMGKEAEDYIGLRRMTALLGDEGIRLLSEAFPDMEVSRKPGDYSMLYLRSREDPWKVFEFYPMAQVPPTASDLEGMRRTMVRGFEELVGVYGQGSFVAEVPGAAVSAEMCGKLFLAVACSAKDAPLPGGKPLPDYVRPVLGGAVYYEGERREGWSYDDEGAHVSQWNGLLSELSVFHWLWKKDVPSDYVGLCHYRRHFDLTEGLLGEIGRGGVDVILTRPRLTLPDVRTYFSELPLTSMGREEYAGMMEALWEQDGDMAEYAERLFAGNIHFPDNLVIARKEIYEDYASWMFGILETMGLGKRDFPPRSLGYIGELLTTLYFAYHYREYRVRIVDYVLLG